MSPFYNLHWSSKILTNSSNHITHLIVSSLGIRITCVQFCHLVQMNSTPTQKSFLNRLTHSDDGFRFRTTRVSISTLHAAESADSVLERAQNVHHANCSTTDLLAYLCLPDAALSFSLSLSAYRTRFGEAPRLWSRARHSRSMMVMAYICSDQSSCMLLCGGCSDSMTSRLRRSFPSVVVQRVLNGKRRTGVARPYLASLDTSHQSLGSNAL
jgi:hypothetical protein